MPSSSIGRLAPAAPTTPARRQSGRALRWVLALVGTLAALVIVALIVLTHWDWNRHRPWVNAKVSEATGRHFAIEGDLSVDWHWPQPLETGWRRWVPGVTVQAQQLVMDNPDGFTFAEEPAKGDKTLPALPRKPQPMTEQQVAAAEATSKKLKAAARAEPASAPATVASSASAAAPRASEPATAQAAQAQASYAARALALEKSNAPTAQAPERGPQTMAPSPAPAPHCGSGRCWRARWCSTRSCSPHPTSRWAARPMEPTTGPSSNVTTRRTTPRSPTTPGI